MLPIGDEPNAHVRRPVVTWLLIAANVAVYVWMLVQSAGDERAYEELIKRLGYMPAEWRPETLLTHMFTHAGLVHVGGNMLFLWIFGDNVESRVGHLGFLALYLLTGGAALFAHLAFGGGDPTQVLVGASGAVSGVQGLYFIACPGARVKLLVWMLYVVRTLHVPAKVLMLLWFLLQDVVPIVLRPEGDTVAHWAHVGGFLSGLLLMGFLVPFVGRNDPPVRLSVQERYPHRTPSRRW